MNEFLHEMKAVTNYTNTENGAIIHRSTLNKVLDMFALGGSYRKRSNSDCIVLFQEAYNVDKTLAVKCLFYLRDARGGQGERRFFRVCFNWLCQNYPDHARQLVNEIPTFGRYDDMLFATENTPVFECALNLVKEQLALDVQCKTPSLLAKWLPSENASSITTKRMATKVRQSLNMTNRQYRKTLSILRQRINVLERLMSSNQWDKIEFDKIPSRAGFIYRNAFARRDIIAKQYEAFAKSAETKVNAKVLYPHEVAHQAFNCCTKPGSVDRTMIQKYWDNLPNYYGSREENGLAVVDVSGSMYDTPLEVAVSLGAYVAEKAHGPFANHFVTFSARPQLIEFSGVDITDKFKRAENADWGMNTNIAAVFDLLLNTARRTGAKKEDMPTRLYIFSDMEFDYAATDSQGIRLNKNRMDTLLESIKNKWQQAGYELPQVVFWNLDARNNNIPAIGPGFSYVSGFSPSMIETILSGKDGIDLMLEKLLSDRYKSIN